MWFSFLKIAVTSDWLIEWKQYAAWGLDRDSSLERLSFEKWWKDYGKKLQNPVVHELKESERQSIGKNPLPNTIYLAIPLNRAPARLAGRARHIIQARLDQLYKTEKEKEKIHPKGKSGRFQVGFYGGATFTEGRDIRVGYYRNLLDLYEVVLRKHSKKLGMEALKTINAVAKRNAERNAVRKAKGLKPQDQPTLPEFRIYSTAFMTADELKEVGERRKYENEWENLKRSKDERAARIAAGLETDAEWRSSQTYTVVDKRLDYQQNPAVVRALLNLHRAKKAFHAVLRAVARGEFPGKSVQRP